MFLVDSSGSVRQTNFQKEIDFIASIISQGLNLRSNHRVAVLTFDDDVSVKFYLDEFSRNSDALNGLGIFYDGGTTDTADALQDMRRTLFSTNRGDRVGVPNVGVLVTDGRSDDPDDTWDEAKQARMAGTDVLVIGVGNNIRSLELEGIATSPVSANVIKIDGFDSFDLVVSSLTEAICNSEYMLDCCQETRFTVACSDISG